MTARLIDGKAFAAGLRAKIAAAVPAFAAATGRAPGLAVVATVLALNVLGEALRLRLDRGRRG